MLERASRWSACLSAIAAGAGQGAAEVAASLRGRLSRVHDLMRPVWAAVGAALDGASPDGAADASVNDALNAASRELSHLEQALRKLPGLPVRSETYGLLEELGPQGSRIPPVVLDSEDQERDEDGFLSLQIAQVAAPLAWPRLAFGLAAARKPEGDGVDWDLQASGWLGPAYLFMLVDRAAALPQPAADLVGRLALVHADLDVRQLLVPEARHAVADLAADIDRAQVAGRGHDSAFKAGDLVAAEAAAARLADGVLAGARPTADRESIRAARERLLADPAGGPEAVYAALGGLREEPLSGAQILTGGWLYRERSRKGWLRRAIDSSDPFAVYGDEILRLDSLLLKSLETASVHRRLAMA